MRHVLRRVGTGVRPGRWRPLPTSLVRNGTHVAVNQDPDPVLGDRFVALRTSDDSCGSSSSEVTVYVKGFLSPNEDAEHYDAWQASHAALGVGRHAWGPDALGWAWHSGRLPGPQRLPVPVATVMHAAYHVWTRGRLLRGLGGPVALGAAVATELVSVTGQLLYQYVCAMQRLDEHATLLSQRLAQLREQHDTLRVVAHSLGCRLTMEALRRLPRDQRPCEVHLCAAACVEPAYAPLWSESSRPDGRGTFVYHCERDLILSTAFLAMHWEQAVGCIGLAGDYDGVQCADTDAHFDTWVHREYPSRFANFARCGQSFVLERNKLPVEGATCPLHE